MKRKVVVIGHGYTSRLGVIRSVGQIGCDVTVIVMTSYKRMSKELSTKKPIDCFSKYVSRYLFCHLRDEEGLIQLLLKECVDPNQKVVIIPDSDFSAAAIDKNQERLKEHFLFPHIHHTPGTIVKWMDKQRQKDAARKVGLHVAKSCTIQIKEENYHLPANISYPCFIKPQATIVGGKSFLKRCNNKEELDTALHTIALLGDMQVLVEDFKTIDTEYAAVGFSNGEDVIIPAVMQILEMSHGGHFGVACLGKVMPTMGFEKEINKFKDLIREIGYFGLFDVDFYSSGNEKFFCELNLRFGGSGHATTLLGVNLPGMFVKSILGQDITGMRKSVNTSSIYVNERMCIDDWYKGFITTREYRKILAKAHLKFIEDPQDSSPEEKLKNELRILRIKRFIKKLMQK